MGFLVIFVVAGVLSQKCPYVYGESLLVTPVLSESKKAQLLIDENFGKKNIVAVMLPGHDYEAESNYIKTLEGTNEVNTVTGLANTEVEDGYMLTDRLTPRELSEVMDIEYEVCVLLYEAYAADQDEYGRIITGVSNYRIPLMDVVSFAAEKVRDGYVELDESTTEDLFDADDQIREGRDQLEGENYDRILVDLALPEESDKTYDFLEQMHQIGADYYDRSNEIYVVGDSTSDFELKQAFDLDNIIVSVVSILFVLVVLLFTFNSIGLPLMQILVIEGAIFINFAIPAVFGWNIFFLSYLIVSSIQMGANIDYAIVISTRYIESRKRLNREESIIEALNFAIATIISSGTIMVLAGTAIGMMSSGPSIVGLGQALGRGTVISIILVLFVLPQILILGDGIIRATSFEPYRPIQTREEKGDLYLNGTIQGEVNGTLIGRYIGVIRGEANVSLVAGGMEAVESNVADQIERLIRESEAGGMQEGSDPVRSSEVEGRHPS
ncbi:MAG: MMPL family transporter [Lachnospiraceae bacterium]|nr:MMPL family transporter [Lachnospiraceae bacterium]